MPVHYIAALARYSADAYTSLAQLNNYISSSPLSAQLNSSLYSAKWDTLQQAHTHRLATIAQAAEPKPDDTFGTGHLCATLRRLVPKDAIFAIEAVTNTAFVADNIQATLPGSWINCGGGGLGWSGGGALGIKLASEFEGKGKFVVQIVGDGTFLFSVPSSVYWISQRYKIPILTIVLNNKGWNAPRKSLLLVHPDGLGSKATNEELNIAIAGPDFAGIAKAAAGGNLFAGKVDKASELQELLKQAVESVESGTSAVVEAVVAPGC
jgi:thiamine pyrophosphate-dependent acetolactate synthase large subunit-like protein